MIIKLIKRLLNIKSPSIALTLTPEKAESIIEAFENVIGKRSKGQKGK